MALEHIGETFRNGGNSNMATAKQLAYIERLFEYNYQVMNAYIAKFQVRCGFEAGTPLTKAGAMYLIKELLGEKGK